MPGLIQTGIYALDDFDFERPKASLKAKATSSGPAANEYEVYDYPGEYLQSDEGDGYARVRMKSCTRSSKRSKAAATCAASARARCSA